MRKSQAVPVTLLAVAATFVTGCQDEPRHCVDAEGRIVADSNCSNPGSGSGSGFHYLYGGSSGGRIGDAVIGGSTTPSDGISRGGFGGHGGDGGGGGGE